jgi:predicted nucleic acid-binding protein
LIDDAEMYLSVFVLGEIRKDLERARRNNPAQVRSVENWLTAMGRSFADRILPIDRAIADEWGRISAKCPISTNDALLAATAKVNGMTLVTRNIVNVADLGAKVLTPFEARN